MSSENLELVRKAVTAFTEGNVTAALEILDPEIAIYPPEEDPDQDRVYRGRSGALKYLEQWLDAWEEFQVLGPHGSDTLHTRPRAPFDLRCVLPAVAWLCD